MSQPRQTNLMEYTYAKALLGTDNTKIPTEGNSMLMRGRVVCEEDVRYQQWIQHLCSIGVNVAEYGLNANALSYAYSPEIPDYGVRGEITQIMAPSSKNNNENTNISINPQQQTPEGEAKK